jgi:hypothetical protein
VSGATDSGACSAEETNKLKGWVPFSELDKAGRMALEEYYKKQWDGYLEEEKRTREGHAAQDLVRHKLVCKQLECELCMECELCRQ